MITNLKTLSILLLFLLSLNVASKAQFKSKSYFTDSEQKHGGTITCHIKTPESLYLGGSTFDNFKNEAFIAKVDTAGNIIWSTTQNAKTDTSRLKGSVINLYIKDTLIYALVSGYLWCLNEKDGKSIFKTSLQTSSSSRYPYLFEIDSAHVLSTFISQSEPPRLAIFNKFTGDTVQSRSVGFRSSSDYYLTVDNQGFIYYSDRSKLYKLHPGQLRKEVWVADYEQIDAEVKEIFKLQVDSTNRLFAFAQSNKSRRTDRGVILEVNTINGAVKWQNFVTDRQTVKGVELIDNGGFFYATWQPAYTSNGGFMTSKIDKKDGTLVWYKRHTLEAPGDKPIGTTGSGAAAYSIDFDSEKNIYITGYFADANFGPASWGIAKIESNSGNLIYDLTITNDSSFYDVNSVGQVACVYNDQPRFYGVVDEKYTPNFYHRRTLLNYVLLNGKTGKIMQRTPFLGAYQYKASTIAIKPVSKDKLIVLKQLGRKVALEMYNKEGQVIWKYLIKKEYYVKAGNIQVQGDSIISLLVYSHSYEDEKPFYSSKIDTLYGYAFNTNGKVLKQSVLEINSPNVKPIAYKNGYGGLEYFIYAKDDELRIKPFFGSRYYSELQIDFSYDPQKLVSSYLADYTDSLWFFTINNGKSTPIITLSKYNVDTALLKNTIGGFWQLNSVLKKNDDFIYFFGRDRLAKATVGLYQISTQDTVWTTKYEQFLTIKSASYGKDSNYFYVYGYKMPDTAFVAKISTQDGALIWSFTLNSDSLIVDNKINDIAYDELRKQTVIAGCRTEIENSVEVTKTMIIVLDSNGRQKADFYEGISHEQVNSANCIGKFYNHDVWVGGSLSTDSLKQSGFIYSIDSIKSPVIVTENTFNNQIDQISLAYPNPFDNKIFLLPSIISEIDGEARLELFDSKGRLQYDKNISENFNGQVDVNLVPGVYFLMLKSNDQVFSQTLIKR